MSESASANQHENAEPAPAGLVTRAQRLLGDILRADTDRTLAQRTAFLAFFIRAASAAIALLSQILLARWFGTYQYGIYAFVFVTLVIVGGLIPLGFPTAGQRFIAEYSKNERYGLLRGFLFGSRAFVIAVGTLISVLGALGLWLFGSYFVGSEYLLPLYLILICLPPYALTEVQDGIARNFSWIDLALALPYLMRPLVILSIVGGTMLVAGSADAITGAYALIFAIWFTGILQLAFMNRRLKQQVPDGRRSYRWKAWIVTSLPIFLVESFYMLLTNTDVLVLSIYESPDKVGIYYAAVKTLALISFVPFAVTAASAHKYAEYGASGDTERLAAFVRDTVTWTFWPALGATLAMLAAGEFLLSLFGSEFVEGYPLLFVLVLGLMARATVGPVDRVLNMLGHQNFCALIYAGAFALNLVLNFTLIPQFGMAGAAWATSIALIVESILLFFAARTKLGLNVFIFNRKR